MNKKLVGMVSLILAMFAVVSTVAVSNFSLPIANFTYTPSTPAYGEVVTFNALSSYDPDGYITNYQWDFNGDGIFDATGVVAKYTYESSTMLPSPTNYTVTLTVTDDDGNKVSISKVIQVVYITDINPPFTSIGIPINESEPNNGPGDATEIQLNSNVSGIIYPARDWDTYKIYIPTPGKLTIVLDKVPSNMRARIDLYDKNFRWIARWDASNAGDTLKPKIDIVKPGYYYLGIGDLEGKSHVEGYAFKVSFTP